MPQGLERPLPPSVYLHHGSYYFRTTIAPGKQRAINLGRDLQKALGLHRQYVERHKGHSYVLKALYRHEQQRVGGIPVSLLRKMLKDIQQRAVRRELDCDLTEDTILSLAKRADGRCEISGIPFEFGARGRSMRLWAPSVDRRDCRQGYVATNVRLVCVAVNMALRDFGDDVLLRIARGVVKTAKKSLPINVGK